MVKTFDEFLSPKAAVLEHLEILLLWALASQPVFLEIVSWAIFWSEL